jgi:PhnB protein
MAVKPIPDGYNTVTPYLICKDAAKALDFYKRAFGAEQMVRMDGPGGSIAHAEIKIGNSPIMLADEHPQMGYKSPLEYGGTSVSIVLYVADVDALFKRAIAAGAKEQRAVADQFYGDRMGTLTDPFGHVWSIATHKEDVAPDEMKRRMAEMVKQHSC